MKKKVVTKEDSTIKNYYLGRSLLRKQTLEKIIKIRKEKEKEMTKEEIIREIDEMTEIIDALEED